MRDIADFMPYVLPWVIGCSDPMAEQAVRSAAREFLMATRMWREVASATVVANEVYDELSITGDAVLYEIEAVWFTATGQLPGSGKKLTPEQYAARPPGEVPALWKVTMEQPNVLTLLAPESGRFDISMWLLPSPVADSLPDFMFDNHAETIAAGAKAALLSMASREWYDAATAGYQRGLFQAAKDRFGSFAQTGQHRAAARTVTRY